MSLLLLSVLDSLDTSDPAKLLGTVLIIALTLLFFNSACNCGALSNAGAQHQRQVRNARALRQTKVMNNKSNKRWNFATTAPTPTFQHPTSVALTGARGMVGTGVIKTLIAGGKCKQVVMLDLLPEAKDFKTMAATALKEHGVTLHYISADITDRNAMCDPDGAVQTVLKNADVKAMLHIAALVGPFFPTAAYLRVNYDGTINVLDACKAAGIGAVVDCSSPSTRFDGSDIRGANEDEIWESLGQQYQGLHEYARTKALGEGAVLKAAKETNLSTCAVAPHQVYGPSDRLFLPSLLRNAKKGVLRVMGTGDNCVSFTHESNIAHALLLAAGALVAHEEWKSAGKPTKGPLAILGKAGAKVNGEYMVVTDATEDSPAGLAINFWDAIDDAAKQVGIPPIRSGMKGACRLPYYALLVPIAYAGKIFTAVTGRFINITPFTIRMLVIDRYFDIGKAKVLLGYAPLVSFDDPEGWRAAVTAVYERTAKDEKW